MISEVVKQKIEEKFGKSIRYSKDCEALSESMSSSCKAPISASTLKRLFGFVSGIKQPRQYSLDVIASYLGYRDYSALLLNLTQSENSEFISLPEVKIETLQAGKILEFNYDPGRKIRALYLGDFRFEVCEVQNSKLQINDTFRIHHIVKGYPLMIHDLNRNQQSMGQYISGKVGGITHISIH